MKRQLSALFLGLFLLGMSIPSYSGEDEYYYAWITSCGKTAHMISPRELTTEEALKHLAKFEWELCGVVVDEVDDSECKP